MRLTAVRCGDGLDQEGEEVAPLLTTTRRRRQHPFREPTAPIAVRTEAALASEYGRPQRLLGGVVGRLHARDDDERPQRRPEGEQVATQRLRRGMSPHSTVLQHGAQDRKSVV